MTRTGKLTTFMRLLREEQSITIPKVQRDYAYGRSDAKAKTILAEMLDTMHRALSDNRREIFDFVYGGPYVKDDEGQAGMVPLDGQQRLTTLFLLHFYASLFATDAEGQPVDVSLLRNFSYETRQTANDFRLNLVTDIRSRLIVAKYPQNPVGIKRFIEEDADFSPAYAFDPTISSMLVVLEQIETRFASFPDLWDALTTRDNLCFYHITLEKFGLTDELYIKMNSRGKELTEFEIFKADLLADIRAHAPERHFDMARKLDTEWMDMVWDCFIGDPADADRAYMCLFINLLRIVHYYCDSDAIDLHCHTAAQVELLESLLDFMHSIHVAPGFHGWWGQYFYDDGNVVGRTDRIRLFNMPEPLMLKAMREQLSVPEVIIFVAAYEAWYLQLPAGQAPRRLRIVRNLARANQRANNAHTEHLPAFIADTREIMTTGTLPSLKSPFIGPAVEEEACKLRLPDAEYEALLRYENHQVLDASLALFMDEYLPVSPLNADPVPAADCRGLLEELARFESFFGNDCRAPEHFERLRVSLLDKDIDCWQAPAGNYRYQVKRRFFLHAPKDYSAFFVRSRRRENQSGILQMLRKLGSPASLLPGEEKCKQFDIDDWRYYMACYPASNFPGTGAGCYGWKDIKQAPLEAYILNSTYFEPQNLAWSMMLSILFSRLWGQFELRFDPHQHPLEIVDLGLSVDFTQAGWLISTVDDTDSLHDRLRGMEEWRGLTLTDEKTALLLPHDPAAGEDYIETITRALLSLRSKAE